MSHPMMPEPNHDERAEQLFVRDLKGYLASQIEPHESRLARAVEARTVGEANDVAGVEAVRDGLHEHETFRAYLGLRRISQEMMWDAAAASIDRQARELTDRASNPEKGSLRLDPAFRAPSYVSAFDIHLMPGGYAHDGGQGAIRQGALMDRGGAIYMLGRNGNLLNDARGHTLVAHVFDLYPDFAPKRILELGCGIGATITPVAGYFPEAEIHGVDVGADMLRYAHARASHLGAAVHFSQQNAEATDFADESFDLVFSAVLFHETAAPAVPKILAECRRLLRPGGLMVHLEVPQRYESMDLWGRIRGEIETHYNNEPFWRGAISLNFAAEFAELGFEDIRVGYQPGSFRAVRGQHGFSETPLNGPRDWFLASARKPA